MPRFCSRCNRPLDPEHHDVDTPHVELEGGERIEVMQRQPPLAGFIDGHPVFEDAEPRPGRRTYGCRVRLISQVGGVGKVFVPGGGKFAPQRIKELNTRYVHEDRLAPGGDLAT